METIFINTLNSKKNESNKFIYQFTDKLKNLKNLKNPNTNLARWKNIKSEYINNRFKMSAPIWNDEFNLPDGSYSVSDV